MDETTLAASPCVIAKGVPASRGYVYERHNGRRAGAHRFAYEAAYGPIPDGLMVCRMVRRAELCEP